MPSIRPTLLTVEKAPLRWSASARTRVMMPGKAIATATMERRKTKSGVPVGARARQAPIDEQAKTRCRKGRRDAGP